MIFGRFIGHNLRFANSFWLRLCVVRVLYHMQVWGSPGRSRKFIKNIWVESKVRHVGAVEWTFLEFVILLISWHLLGRGVSEFETNALGRFSLVVWIM